MRIGESAEAVLPKPGLAGERSELSLDEEAALREVSLIKARLEQRETRREPTAEDYSFALAAVQELQQAVSEETDAKKMLYRAGRALHNAARVGAIPIIILDSLLWTVGSNLAPKFEGDEPRDWAGPLSREALNIDATIKDALTDAEKKLTILERLARKKEKKALE